MEYRREIDGLRALAVVPVILFHAGFSVFSGGFVGVDVFFVISGFLITTIILTELQSDRFSVLRFYERRARRILPALFAVMAASLIAGYFTLMPDEFKNLGQSLVATSAFSNNMLLGLTSGYWDLTSEFKPLLHTWSLGVEEQYYVITPILLLITWRYAKRYILPLLLATCVASFAFAAWYVFESPKWAFYLLPTRAWEITMGGICAFTMLRHPELPNHPFSNALSLTGMAMIVASIFGFDNKILAPGPMLLIPTLGACLIILFAKPGTIAHLVLGHKTVVFIGLLSYSLYLWHQPVLAYIRIFSVERPTTAVFGTAVLAVFGVSYLSWRFIETPFRDRKAIDQKAIIGFSLAGSVFFVIAGFLINKNYGYPTRVFDANVRIEDMDKRIYNERVRSFTADQFNLDRKPKILIVGNSFARDFLNITLETFDTSKVQIVYRDDLRQCIQKANTTTEKNLFKTADVIVFASGELEAHCLKADLEHAASLKKQIFYVGTKDFGHNLNWIIRYKGVDRANKYNEINQIDIETDQTMRAAIPPGNYISLLAPILSGNKAPITDEQGHMISTDRRHLTKYGAIFFGKKSVITSKYASIFN